MKRIHVDRRIMAQNQKTGRTDPPITVQTSRGSIKCREAHIIGASEFVYRPHTPLSCGARLWVETRAMVVWA